MLRDTIYIGALLHDIGKFIERSKGYPLEEKFKIVNTGHYKHSAQFLESLIKKNLFFEQFSRDIIELVFYQHQPRNHWDKIIQLADRLSLSEGEEGNTKEKYFHVPLIPTFARVFDSENKELGYGLQELSFTGIFPEKNPMINQKNYKILADSFLKEVSLVKNETQLIYLLEKYLWCVPAQTTNYVPDISLYDHSKTTAAIALCLFDQYETGNLREIDLGEMETSKKEQFMLINGDFSGIQDFIFNIPSKGAAKTLKGHSVYINLLSDMLTKFLIRELDLKEANILYNGGGNFYILAPKSKEGKFLTLKRKISKLLLDVHGGDIYLALDYISLCPADFKKFNIQWDRVKEKVNNQKNKKWSEIGLQENYDLVFGPFGSGSKEKEHCHICGIEKEKRSIYLNHENDKMYCSLCRSFIDLTDSLKNADCLVIEESRENSKNIETYQDVFRNFGYEYFFFPGDRVRNSNKTSVYLLNNTNFLHKGYQGYKMGAMKLPLKDNNREQLSFDEIALKSKGDKKLALLKLDVDNLGNLFSRGLGKISTISRVTSLSRMLGLYFEGYINYLIKENQWENYLYVVFSGGDDTFIVGAWDKVMDFAEKFYHKFRKFTCHHPKITFSAGICIFNYDYPIVMSSQITEEALEEAKNFLVQGEDIPEKNKVCLFGEVFNWEEFKRIKEFKTLLLEIIERNSRKKEGFGRAFLFKIGKTTLGFRKILEDSLKGRVNNLRFWRLAYYLRDISRNDAENLISQYKEIVINNLLQKSNDKKIKNIMIVPAAVKWAQMETRKVGEGDNER